MARFLEAFSWRVTNSSAAVGTPGTCDGNGNGIIGGASAASQSGERFQFWRQLAHAGMIEGSYTGLAGAGGTQHATPIANVLAGKMSNSGWYVSYLESFIGNISTLALDYGNYLFMGAANSTSWPSGAVLRPEEMWNIDVKMDDGKIAAGKIVSLWWDDCGTGTASTDLNAEYDVRSTNIACTPIMRHAF